MAPRPAGAARAAGARALVRHGVQSSPRGLRAIACGAAMASALLAVRLCFTALGSTVSEPRRSLRQTAAAAPAEAAALQELGGLLPGERFVAMNRYRIREGAEKQFEQRWGRGSALGGLDGFRWFSLLRRVSSTPKSTGALSVVYNYDDEQFEDDYTYVSLGIWDSKTQFDAAQATTEGDAGLTKIAINGLATATGPPKPAFWDGMLLERKEAAPKSGSDVFAVMNRFTVKDGNEEEFEQRWAKRESKLQEADGFQFFQLMRRAQTPDDDVNYISMSVWTDRDAFDHWWNSKSFANMAQVQGSLLESEIVRYFYEGVLVEESSQGI